MKLSEKLSIQPELLFKDPRGAANVSPDVFGNANLDPLLANATVSAKLAYVSIPILLKYHLSPQLSLGFGPQIGILSSAKKVYVAEVYSEEDLVYKDNVKSTLNDLDFALAFNLEYKADQEEGRPYRSPVLSRPDRYHQGQPGRIRQELRDPDQPRDPPGGEIQGEIGRTGGGAGLLGPGVGRLEVDVAGSRSGRRGS